MGKPLMIQNQDHQRIDRLKKRLGVRTKIDVVRSGLDLLERDIDKAARVSQWKKAAGRIGGASREVLKDFNRHSRLRRNG